MVLNQKPTGRATSMPMGLMIGATVNLGITLLSVGLIAKLVEGEGIAESQIGYAVMIMLMASAFLGALTAARKIRRQRLLVCALSGLVYFGILLGITALFFGGQYEAVVATCLLVMGGSMLAAITGTPMKRIGKRSKNRKWNR